MTDSDVEELRSFFRGRRQLTFDLVRVAEFPDVVVYAVPKPDEELRGTMRALWAQYPRYPPYGRPDSDPPPHATLGRLEGDHAISLAAARERVEPLLPVRCEIRGATLMEEFERDRMRIRASLPFGGQRGPDAGGR